MVSCLLLPGGTDRTVSAAVAKAPFRRGLVTTLSNPKSGVFWTSVFAVAVPVGAPSSFHVAAVTLILVQSLLWYGLVALWFASGPARRGTRRAANKIGRASGRYRGCVCAYISVGHSSFK